MLTLRFVRNTMLKKSTQLRVTLIKRSLTVALDLYNRILNVYEDTVHNATGK